MSEDAGRRKLGVEICNPFVGLPLLERLRGLHRDPDAEVRGQSLLAVLRHHCADRCALEAIRLGLADTAAENRLIAAEASRHLPPCAMQPLAELALTDADAKVRAVATKAVASARRQGQALVEPQPPAQAPRPCRSGTLPQSAVILDRHALTLWTGVHSKTWSSRDLRCRSAAEASEGRGLRLWGLEPVRGNPAGGIGEDAPRRPHVEQSAAVTLL